MCTVVTYLATAVVGNQAFLVVLALYKAPETTVNMIMAYIILKAKVQFKMAYILVKTHTVP